MNIDNLGERRHHRESNRPDGWLSPWACHPRSSSETRPGAASLLFLLLAVRRQCHRITNCRLLQT